jgi:hypothetical protein
MEHGIKAKDGGFRCGRFHFATKSIDFNSMLV